MNLSYSIKTVCFFLLLGSFLLLNACKDSSCTDGEQNQFETGIDCGGPCPICNDNPITVDTTNTNNQNQNDTIMSASIGGTAWEANNIVSSVSINDVLTIVGALGTQTIALEYGGAFGVGSYQLGGDNTATYTADGVVHFADFGENNGTITFSQFDVGNQIVSGTFSFDAAADSVSTPISITQGVFTNIKY